MAGVAGAALLAALEKKALRLIEAGADVKAMDWGVSVESGGACGVMGSGGRGGGEAEGGGVDGGSTR